MSADSKDTVARYGRRLTWILLTTVVLGMFTYFRMSGQLAQFVEGMWSPSKPAVSQKAETTITITKEATPRMIEIPAFYTLDYGAVEDDVAYIAHAHLRDELDPTKIERFFFPARKDRPSDWVNPLAEKNITRIGFTLDPDSTRVTGHIECVFRK